jgi:hypothetical protein
MPDETKEAKLGGNISLINFGQLEPSELVIVRKIVGASVKKLTEKTVYKGLKLRLKQNQHGNSFMHEIDAEALISDSQSEDKGRNIILSASSNNRNLFTALSEVLEKISSEADHRIRSTKQVGKDIRRKEKKQVNEDIEI